MEYIALLRGINVGGKSIVSMASLKKAFAEAGFTDISTYINSGNVLFASDEEDIDKLTAAVETMLGKSFFPLTVVLITDRQLADVLQQIPKNWETEDLRKYIAFVKLPMTPDDVVREADLTPGIDFIATGPGVVYLSTKTAGLTSSRFPKLISKKIYQHMTMRNFNTIHTLARLM